MKRTFMTLLVFLGLVAMAVPGFAASRNAQELPLEKVIVAQQQPTSPKKQRMFHRLTKRITASPLGIKLTNKRIWALVLGGLGLVGGFMSLLVALFLSAVLGILGVLVAGAFIIAGGILWFV